MSERPPTDILDDLYQLHRANALHEALSDTLESVVKLEASINAYCGNFLEGCQAQTDAKKILEYVEQLAAEIRKRQEDIDAIHFSVLDYHPHKTTH